MKRFILGFYYSLYYFYEKILKTINAPFYATAAFAFLQGMNIISLFLLLILLGIINVENYSSIVAPILLLSLAIYSFIFHINKRYVDIFKPYIRGQIKIKTWQIVIYIIYSVGSIIVFMEMPILIKHAK